MVRTGDEEIRLESSITHTDSNSHSIHHVNSADYAKSVSEKDADMEEDKSTTEGSCEGSEEASSPTSKKHLGLYTKEERSKKI